MLTYRDFVKELRPLVDQAKHLVDLNGIHENPIFRKWRHEVTDLIERIESVGYTVNCSIRQKRFDRRGSYTYTPTAHDRIEAFNRDLQDTINELATVIDRFYKFGDPKGSIASPGPSNPLKAPEKITAAWL